MTYTEEVAVFSCQGEAMVGIVAKPEKPLPTGVVVIVGGPQYRAGSHRQFVLLSRTLASSGIAVLRFDCRGMGDSKGELRDFESASQDVGAAINALQATVPEVKQIALWGLCDGASAALLYLDETADLRVKGLCLLNPWVRSAASQARTQVKHYYTQRLMQKEFWVKLLRGGVARSALAGLAGSLRVAFAGTPRDADAEQIDLAGKPQPRQSPPFQRRMAQAWQAFSGNICLVLSGNDYTAKEFLDYVSQETSWRLAMTHPQLRRHDLPLADHTFSADKDRQTVEALTVDWLRAGQS